MDPAAQGTGGLVLNKIDAVLKLLADSPQLPLNCITGLCQAPNGAGRVDTNNRFLLLEWAPLSSGPADFRESRTTLRRLCRALLRTGKVRRSYEEKYCCQLKKGSAAIQNNPNNVQVRSIQSCSRCQRPLSASTPHQLRTASPISLPRGAIK
jgi:hypothetical protein